MLFSLFPGGKIKTASDEHALKQNPSMLKTRKKAAEALRFCTNNGYNTTWCLLADMGVHSGLKRLFVWDFARDSILFSGLVSHGCGSNAWGSDESREDPVFKNEHESYCSSIGKYKIGARGYSNWGIHVKYLLHGLDKTNSNALSRQIVFHSWNQVADEEVYPQGAPEGWGCPAVSDRMMKQVDALLKDEKISVLLYMYE